MARKQQLKARPVQASRVQDTARTLWFAGLGAVSVARKQGEKVFTGLVNEGQTLQNNAEQVARRVQGQTAKRISTIVGPVRQRIGEEVAKANTAVEQGVGRVLARLGVPSKGDIEELTHRVGLLSRQLRAAKR
jgi:poly(hydroxyalkanoate) granule-associated protein